MSSLDWKELNLRYVRIDVLLDKENTKVYRVKDSVTNDIRVMKIRKGRDLTGIYRQLEEVHHPNHMWWVKWTRCLDNILPSL